MFPQKWVWPYCLGFVNVLFCQFGLCKWFVLKESKMARTFVYYCYWFSSVCHLMFFLKHQIRLLHACFQFKFKKSVRADRQKTEQKGMHWRFILSKNKYSPSCLLIYLITTALWCMLTCATINPVLVQIQKYTSILKTIAGYIYI